MGHHHILQCPNLFGVSQTVMAIQLTDFTFIKTAQHHVHPTLGILARFQAFFYASALSQSDGVPPPAPARVTQTVSWLVTQSHKEREIYELLLNFQRSSKHILAS